MSKEPVVLDREVVELMAKVVTGLQAPMSISSQILGTAYVPLCELRARLNIFGWPNDETVFEAFEKNGRVEEGE